MPHSGQNFAFGGQAVLQPEQNKMLLETRWLMMRLRTYGIQLKT